MVAKRSTALVLRALPRRATRWHSSSSWPPQTKDQANNSNNSTDTTEAATEETSAVQAKATKASEAPIATKENKSLSTPPAPEQEPIKRPISVRAHATTIKTKHHKVVSPPTVNSTQHLDMATLRNDIFYGGYRPILTPLRRPVKKTKKTPTIPLSWNQSACKLETFDDYSKVPQFVVDKLVPFSTPQKPGNEIRLGAKSRKEQKEMERLSAEVYEFIKHFRK